MTVDHKNGNKLDYSESNIQVICRPCHLKAEHVRGVPNTAGLAVRWTDPTMRDIRRRRLSRAMKKMWAERKAGLRPMVRFVPRHKRHGAKG